jgi:hypothetical protein
VGGSSKASSCNRPPPRAGGSSVSLSAAEPWLHGSEGSSGLLWLGDLSHGKAPRLRLAVLAFQAMVSCCVGQPRRLALVAAAFAVRKGLRRVFKALQDRLRRRKWCLGEVLKPGEAGSTPRASRGGGSVRKEAVPSGAVAVAAEADSGAALRPSQRPKADSQSSEGGIGSVSIGSQSSEGALRSSRDRAATSSTSQAVLPERAAARQETMAQRTRRLRLQREEQLRQWQSAPRSNVDHNNSVGLAPPTTVVPLDETASAAVANGARLSPSHLPSGVAKAAADGADCGAPDDMSPRWVVETRRNSGSRRRPSEIRPGSSLLMRHYHSNQQSGSPVAAAVGAAEMSPSLPSPHSFKTPTRAASGRRPFAAASPAPANSNGNSNAAGRDVSLARDAGFTLDAKENAVALDAKQSRAVTGAVEQWMAVSDANSGGRLAATQVPPCPTLPSTATQVSETLVPSQTAASQTATMSLNSTSGSPKTPKFTDSLAALRSQYSAARKRFSRKEAAHCADAPQNSAQLPASSSGSDDCSHSTVAPFLNHGLLN